MKFFVVSARRIGAAGVAAATVLLLCAVMSAAGVFKVNGREVPIYSVERSDNKIALTFDCAWGNDDIADICEILKKHNARATFFIVGTWAEKYPDSVKLLWQNGHEIGNHSYNHAHYSRLERDELLSDMDKCDSAIRQITGTAPRLLRAPYGEYNDRVIEVCDLSAHTYIQWSVDSIDYGDASGADIIRRSTEKTGSGDIILLHSGTKNTASSLDEILTRLSEFEAVTVSELIYPDNYIIDHKGTQKPRQGF